MELITKIILEGKNLGAESGKDELGNYFIKYFLDNKDEKIIITVYPKNKDIEKTRDG